MENEEQVQEQVEQVQEQPQEEAPSVGDLVKDLTEQFNAKLTAERAKSAKAIKERDDLIKQLLGGQNEPQKDVVDEIVDGINARRSYKW